MTAAEQSAVRNLRRLPENRRTQAEEALDNAPVGATTSAVRNVPLSDSFGSSGRQRGKDGYAVPLVSHGLDMGGLWVTVRRHRCGVR